MFYYITSFYYITFETMEISPTITNPTSEYSCYNFDLRLYGIFPNTETENGFIERPSCMVVPSMFIEATPVGASNNTLI